MTASSHKANVESPTGIQEPTRRFGSAIRNTHVALLLLAEYDNYFNTLWSGQHRPRIDYIKDLEGKGFTKQESSLAILAAEVRIKSTSRLFQKHVHADRCRGGGAAAVSHSDRLARCKQSAPAVNSSGFRFWIHGLGFRVRGLEVKIFILDLTYGIHQII